MAALTVVEKVVKYLEYLFKNRYEDHELPLIEENITLSQRLKEV